MATILIVDDQAGVRETLAFVFQLQEHTVLKAASGFEALSIVERKTPDATLVDIHMP